MKLIKHNKVVFICDSCSKKMRQENAVCGHCGVVNDEAREFWFEEYKKNKKERFKKQSEEFYDLFDDGCQRVAFEKLMEVKQITIKDLVAVLEMDGFFNKLIEKYSIEFKDERDKFNWMYKRAMSLAKWWNREQAAFLGTQQSQGHPYLMYLPGQVPEDVVEIRNKADWSVKKAMRYDNTELAKKLVEIKEQMGISSK